MKGLGSVVETFRRAPPVVVDAAIVLAILVFGSVEYLIFPETDLPIGVLSLLLFTGSALSLLVRRRHPWVPYAVFHSCAVVGLLAHHTGIFSGSGELIALVVVYAVAERTRFVPAALVMVAETLIWVYTPWPFIPAPLPHGIDLLAATLFHGSLFGLAWFAGRAQRRRRRLAAQLQRRADQLRAERERLAQQAVRTEQTRIADELRSLVSRGIDLMRAQAGAARLQLGGDSTRAVEAIGRVEATGRRTLVEMRRLLAVLRRVEGTSGVAPVEVAPSDGMVRWRDGSTTVTERRGAAAEPRRPGPDGVAPNFIQRQVPKQWLIDGAIIAALAGSWLLDLWIAGHAQFDPNDRTMMGWLPRVLGTVTVAAFLFRRARPFSVLAVVASSEFLWILLNGNTPSTPDRAVLIAVFSVAEVRSLPWAVAAVGMGMFAWSPLPLHQLCVCLLLIGAWSTFAASSGWSTKEGRRLIGELREQTDLLARTREERIRLAVYVERARVAREMHDVVAHGVTVMVVQAGAARMIAGTDSGRAGEVLADVERIGEDSLHELRSLLGSLRPEPALAPEAEEQSIPSLVENARTTGLVIQLRIEGEAESLDAGLELSVFRIVQEALTNVQKHAPGTRASVLVRYLPQAVELQVTNDGGRPLGDLESIPGAGQGLIGIRERAALFGGEAEAGPTAGGGFQVSARLPFELVPA